MEKESVDIYVCVCGLALMPPYLVVVESDEAYPDILPFEGPSSAAGGGQQQLTRLSQFHVAFQDQLGIGIVRPTEAIHRHLPDNKDERWMDEKTTSSLAVWSSLFRGRTKLLFLSFFLS